MLRVSVKSAINLRDADHMPFAGESDPFVVMQLFDASGEKLGEPQFTTVKKDTCNPEWNEEFAFDDFNEPHTCKLGLSIFDTDTLLGVQQKLADDIVPDDVLGTAEILLEDFRNDGEWKDFALPLAPGTLNISVFNDGWGKCKVLNLRGLSATNLRNTEIGLFRRFGDSSDPYTLIRLGATSLRTKTIRNNLNPAWEESFTYPLNRSENEIVFTIYDQDLLWFDDVLGTAQVNLDELEDDRSERRTMSLGEGNGDISFELCVVSVLTERYNEITSEAAALASEQAEAAALAKAQAENGAGDILTIVVLEAHDLQNTERGLFRRFGDNSDPYAYVTTARQKFRSDTINNNVNPVWNSKPFNFTIDPNDPSVTFEIFDSDWLTFDDSLGRTVLDVSSLASGEWIERTESLGDGCGDVQYKVRLERQQDYRVEKAEGMQRDLEADQAATAEAAKTSAENGAGDICTIAVLSAQFLHNTDRGLFRRFGDNSDPYCMVSAGEQSFRTSTIYNDLNPIWNSQEFSLTLSDDKRVLFTVYDQDLLTFDDILGEFTLETDGLEGGQWHTRTEILEKPGTNEFSLSRGEGQIEFRVRLERQPCIRMERAQSAIESISAEQAEALDAAKCEAETGAGFVAYVQVLAGHDLREEDKATLMGDHSDPYVKVMLGDAILMTDVADDNRNPTWNTNEVFKFETGDISVPLRFECFDSDFFTQDDLMGETTIDLGAIECGQWLESKENLGDGNGELSIKLRVERQPKVRLDRVMAERVEMWRVQQELREQRKQTAIRSRGLQPPCGYPED